MVYEDLIELPPSQFRRACGVSRQTFVAMLGGVKPFLNRTGKRGGQNCLSAKNQLLLTLQYWREYRTQFHLGLDFCVSESTICRIITKVETLLVQSRQFRLPGKRCLLEPEADLEVVLIDVSEVEVERPQKTTSVLQWQEKASHLESTVGDGL